MAETALLYRVEEQFRRRVLEQDATALHQLSQSWAAVDKRLAGDMQGLAELIAAKTEAGEEITRVQVLRMERYRALRAQIHDEITRLAVMSDGVIAGGQATMIDLGTDYALRSTLAALPPGTTESILAQAGLAWNRLPVDALQAMVGFAGNGSPLRALLDAIPGQTVTRMDTLLQQAVGLGWNPGKTAQMMHNEIGLSLERAYTISRTEQLRAFRTATQRNYQANSHLVEKYRWVAALSPRTCAACLALDGKEFYLEEQPAMHVNDRCTIIPVTVSWRKLGIPVDEPPSTRPSGAEWFAQQPEAVQSQVLGKGRFKAYKDGAALDDFVEYYSSPEWGVSVGIKPLSDMGAVPRIPPAPEFGKPVKITDFEVTDWTGKKKVYETATQYGQLVLGTEKAWGGGSMGRIYDAASKRTVASFPKGAKVGNMKAAAEELARLADWSRLQRLSKTQSSYFQRRWHSILEKYGGSLSGG